MLRLVDLQCLCDSQADVIEFSNPAVYFAFTPRGGALRSVGIRQREKGQQMIQLLLPVNFIFSSLAPSAVI